MYNSFCESLETTPTIVTVIGEVKAEASEDVDSSVPQTMFPSASVSKRLAPEQPLIFVNCTAPPVMFKPLATVEVVGPVILIAGTCNPPSAVVVTPTVPKLVSAGSIAKVL